MTRPRLQARPATVFDDVRAGFETVAAQARHVRIREDLIPAYADSLACNAPQNVLDPAYHYQGDAESTAAYILVLDSVNFGSGYETGMVCEGWDLVDGSLYFTLALRLKNHFEQYEPIQAAQLSMFGRADCVRLLGLSEHGPYSYDFAELCAGSLRELGAMVAGKYGGSYLSFVNAAAGSADLMVEMLAGLRYFNDTHMYRGQQIPFYKRAQITAADLHVAFRRFGGDLFHDIGDLTMFADNAVPHVFHVDGLLEYSDRLATHIARGLEIPSGTEEEIEIRGCAGYLVERIAAHKDMIPMDIDHILWHKSVEDARYRRAEPHRTLSAFY